MSSTNEPSATPRLHGPPFALPRAVDECSERWWRLPPRGRALVVIVVVVALFAIGEGRIRLTQQRWGGPARTALIATTHGNVGDPPSVRAVQLPPAMVPADAPQQIEPDARLALALPEGGVLTRMHLSERGAAAGVGDDRRVVPLPAPNGLDVVPGGAVDVWVLGTSGNGSRRIAEGRAVIAVADGDDDPVALVALATEEVGAAMRALAQDDIVLTQAPP